ncbi:NitT/TauT family transport system substrate-binding protein [Anaerocolumna jejuensis DSM 15929]|uniref:NitT/TauT family transport system substrate-binding protein n=1 Tax=Anaerocolumna jejuensis DSM 15929 TaxID=1121322 RepID=A0A1M7A8Y8_9FIRM|nr:ABC transporter substrate-binding protein [Anaerocolumna jejuensis]SHL39075.1 NitT/TauT family transport system substrate-binding protein [Anaerocolumna jejuensis DSM 15929]
MKRKGIAVLAVILLVAVFLPGCSKSDGNLTKVQLNEVAHSIFYAPQYAAIELGYFKDEGIDLALVNGLGADKTMTAVLSGDADIGFMGPEATVYVYNEGKEDYVVNFAQLTQRAGNFLVTKDKNETFTWDNLKGKTVVGGRAGGMPEMVFEYILKKNGLDPKSDLSIVQNIDFGLTAQAFAAGTGDYTIEFEPAATALEKEGTGKVAASLGVESGKVPYTAYSAKKSYIEKHPEVIQKFTNAVQKGLDYVNSHKPEEIAKTIQPQFKETDLDTLTAIVKRYYDQQTWKENTVFQEDSFNLLQDILEDGGVISTRAPYDKVVTTVYAEKAK